MNARQLKALEKKPLESDLEKKVCKYLKSLGAYCRKFTSPSQRAVPDRLFVIHGNTGFLELKRKGEKPTKAQQLEIEELLKHGAVATWADNFDDAKRFIDRVAEGSQRHLLHFCCTKMDILKGVQDADVLS